MSFESYVLEINVKCVTDSNGNWLGYHLNPVKKQWMIYIVLQISKWSINILTNKLYKL